VSILIECSYMQRMESAKSFGYPAVLLPNSFCHHSRFVTASLHRFIVMLLSFCHHKLHMQHGHATIFPIMKAVQTNNTSSRTKLIQQQHTARAAASHPYLLWSGGLRWGSTRLASGQLSNQLYKLKRKRNKNMLPNAQH
jgi:hypothetical protein